jgi:uroporphyrin-III C-methyltransferase/precorrin-2 dehydrogenase/sirohydrochlorin ferrochelatase/uroporphyrin-III C-methyltransferase
MQQKTHFGKVILAGAGCGDPELITVKAARYLGEADIVITDRLVSQTILDTYVASGVPIIYVGKQNQQNGSTPQIDINQIIVDAASKHKLVVRLKGGDIAFFSNILDELQTLNQHGIAYELVPGITAASGASAYTGIPLTARGFATSVRFLTNYSSTVVTNTYWKDLAKTSDTLVFVRSMRRFSRSGGLWGGPGSGSGRRGAAARLGNVRDLFFGGRDRGGIVTGP